MEELSQASKAEFKLSENRALYYKPEFRNLLKKCPELLRGTKEVVEKIQQWLAAPDPETYPLDEDTSYVFSDNLKLEFTGAKDEDNFGDYYQKQIVYCKVHAGDEDFFLKAAPGRYHSGGVSEALATDFLKEQLEKNDLKGIQVIDCIAAYQSGENKYYLSTFYNPENLQSLEGILETSEKDWPANFPNSNFTNVVLRVNQVLKILKANKMFDADYTHNMFYDREKDIILVFDVNPR